MYSEIDNKNLALIYTYDFFIYFIPFSVFLVFLICLLVFIVYYSSTNTSNTSPNLIKSFILLVSLFCILLFFINFTIPNYSISLLSNKFVTTPFTFIIQNFLLVIYILILIFSLKYWQIKKILTVESLYLLFCSFFGLYFLINANNFLLFYLLLEVYNLAIYAAIGLRKNSNYSLEASIKYFIVGAVSSGLLLFSISLIYKFTGSINFSELSLYLFLNTNFSLAFAFTLFFVAFLIKLGVAPFHFWAVDVYDGAPLYITFYLFLIPKIVFFSIFINFFFNIFVNLNFFLNKLIIFLIIITSLIGVFGAIYQTKIKKILIYSMIFNFSFFLIPFLINSILGYTYLLYFLFIYCVNIIGIIFILLCLFNWSTSLFLKNIQTLNHIFNVNSHLMYSFVILLLSLAGLPPLAGFFGKFYLLLLLIMNNFIWLANFLIIISTIGIFYYLKLVKTIFFLIKSNLNAYVLLKPISKSITLIIILTIIFNIFFIFFSKNLFLFCFSICSTFLVI